MKIYILSVLLLFPLISRGQNIVFSYEVETISGSASNVKVFAQEAAGGVENLVGFTVDFYYDNTESTLTAFDISPVSALGWNVSEDHSLHQADNNSSVLIVHTGYGEINVIDQNITGTDIGTTPVHIVTLNFDHSAGTSTASEGFLASTANNRTALAYAEWDGNNFNEHDVNVTGPQSQPLPVELLFFRAYPSGEQAQLEWATTAEINSDRFEVQHSLDAKSFKKIGEIGAAGYSAELRQYGFLHETPAAAVNYYRLKQFDRDGHFSFSEVVGVDFSSSAKPTIYPNPASDFILVDLPQEGVYEITLFDENGRPALSVNQENRLNVKQLPPGTYWTQIVEKERMVVSWAKISIIH